MDRRNDTDEELGLAPRVTEDVTKLPKWAQRHISVLNSRIQTLEEKLQDDRDRIAVSDPYNTPTVAACDRHDIVRWALYGNFTDDTEDWIDISRPAEGRITIRGSGPLSVELNVTNSFHVSLVDPIEGP